MKIEELEQRLATLEQPERNTEGWMILGVIICGTILTTPWVGVLTGAEWVALVTLLTGGYATARTIKKQKE